MMTLVLWPEPAYDISVQVCEFGLSDEPTAQRILSGRYFLNRRVASLRIGP